MYKGQAGWVYGFMVRNAPPVKKQDIYGAFTTLFQKYELFTSRARRRSSAYSSVAAARGLKENRKRIGPQFQLNYDALEKMESVSITDNQAMNFLKKGIEHDTRK